MKSRKPKSKAKKSPAKKTQKQPAPVIEQRSYPVKEYVLAGIILFITATMFYWQTLPYEYVLDDKVVIQENQFVDKGFGGLADIFSTESFQGYFGEQKNLLVGARYRPLSIASFAIEVGIFGKDPMIGHLGNILFYGISVILLFFMLHSFRLSPRASSLFTGIPFWATLLYGLHPLHTEVVANIKGRDELFAFLFMAAALWAVMAAYEKREWWRLPLIFLLSFMGMMSKENALSLVPLVPVTLYFFRNWDMKKVLRTTAPVAIAAVLYLLIRRAVIGFWLDPGVEISDIMNNPFYGLSFGDKMATVMYTLLLYLKLLVFPHPLTHDYYPYQIPIMNFGQLLPWAGLVSYVVITFFALKGSIRKSIMSYSVWFYLLTLFLVSNVMFTVGTTMNERFLFVPSVGYTLLLSWVLLKVLPEKWAVPKFLPFSLMVLIGIGYSVKGFTRVPAWRNTLTLNQASIKVSTNSARANLFMGTALFNEYKAETDPERRKELLDQADAYITKAVRIHPDYGSAWNMYAGMAAQQFNYDQDLAKMLDRFKEVISHRATLKYVFEYCEYMNDKYGPTRQMLDFYIDVGNMLARENRDYNSAIHYLNYAYKMDPTDTAVIEAIGNTYRLAGNETKAREFLGSIGKQ